MSDDDKKATHGTADEADTLKHIGGSESDAWGMSPMDPGRWPDRGLALVLPLSLDLDRTLFPDAGRLPDRAETQTDGWGAGSPYALAGAPRVRVVGSAASGRVVLCLRLRRRSLALAMAAPAR
jgi:hypothetical protein